MNAFEKYIRAEQDASSEHKFPRHTIGDFIRAVMEIHDPAEAKEFREGCIAYFQSIQNMPISRAVTVTDANIGWCFGEGMADVDRQMWAALGSSHPVFGNVVPTPEEAVRAGIKRGEAQK
jgi:hypothetical protein